MGWSKRKWGRSSIAEEDFLGLSENPLRKNVLGLSIISAAEDVFSKGIYSSACGKTGI
jgi:hypothetical protein